MSRFKNIYNGVKHFLSPANNQRFTIIFSYSALFIWLSSSELVVKA